MRSGTRITLALAVAVLTASAANAQLCGVGVYADPLGSATTIEPNAGQEFDAYVIAFVQDGMNAVAMQIDIPGLGDDIFLLGAFYGPGGTGISIYTNSGGEAIGLGECASGIGDVPIVIARYTLVIPNDPIGSREISVLPNADFSGTHVIYNSCFDFEKPCDSANALVVGQPVAAESQAWGAVKSLYDQR